MNFYADLNPKTVLIWYFEIHFDKAVIPYIYTYLYLHLC